MNFQTLDSTSAGDLSPSVSSAWSATETPVQQGPQAPLGTTAKSVGRSAGGGGTRREVRAARYRHQRHAAALLGRGARVGLCRYAVQSRSRGVGVVGSTYGGDSQVHAAFGGLQTCGSVWQCPVCSARISETRRDEMNDLLAWARAEGHVILMITLTARHGEGDDLADLLDRLKDAKRRLHQHRAWRALKAAIVGSVTATEVTGGGRSGWHPHLHMIVVLRRDMSRLDLGDAWRGALRGAGLDGSGAAYQEQGADAAGAYIAKGSWGAAEELTLERRKAGRPGGGRTPAQLLAASCDDGDRRAGALWREYAKTFHGKRQLVWSRGLKALAGVGEVDDAAAAEDEGQDGQDSAEIARISHDDWRGSGTFLGARGRRARILDAAETDGAEGVARVVADGGGDHASDPLIEAIDITDKEDRHGRDDAGAAQARAEGSRSRGGLDRGYGARGGGSGGYAPRVGGLAAAALAEVRSASG